MVVYKANPFCPYCGEEHAWFNIVITDREQAQVDAYYAANKDKSNLELLLMPPPFYVSKEFQCPMCQGRYKADVAICREFKQPPQVQRAYQMRELARQQGKETALIESIRNVMANLNLTLEQATTVLNIPEIDRPKYKELLQKQ